MMCSEVTDLLSQYLDGELDELRRLGVHRHLEKCSGCRRDLATLSKAVRVIRSVADLEPPRDYRSAVLYTGSPKDPHRDSGAGKGGG